MRILIAEDEKSLNKILVSRLAAEHYSVDACFDGQEALDYLCLLYTSPSPRDQRGSRMPSSA